jgi:hypothetical protein
VPVIAAGEVVGGAGGCGVTDRNCSGGGGRKRIGSRLWRVRRRVRRDGQHGERALSRHRARAAWLESLVAHGV